MLLVVCIFQLIRMDFVGSAGLNLGEAGLEFSAQADRPGGEGDILLLYDSQSSDSSALAENYRAVLDFYQLGYAEADVRRQHAPALPGEAGKIFCCVQDLQQVENLPEMFSWMERGGSFVQSVFPEVNGVYYSYQSYFGINEIGDSLAHEGLNFSEGFLFLSRKTSFSYPGNHSFAHSLMLNASCTLLAWSADSTPLLWKTPKGEGELYVSNTTSLLRRESRGILTGLLGQIEDNLLYPVSNTLTVILDGYIFPLTPQVSQLVYSKYQTNYRHYLNTMVSEPAVKLQKKYGVRYTVSFVNALNADTAAPFRSDGLTRNELISSVSPLLNAGGELAVCGYNYKPLGVEGEYAEEGLFTPFPTQADMSANLDKTIGFAKDCFPGYQPATYIPPGGQVSPTALGLIERDTDLKIVVGTYDSAWKNELVQEFGLKDGLYCYPKITRLDREDTPVEFSAVSSLMATGTVSIDLNLLDQLLQSDADLRGCWEQLESILKDFQLNYPYVSFETVTEAARAVNRVQSVPIIREETQDGLRIRLEGGEGEPQFILHTSREIAETSGCSAQQQGTGAYLIRAQHREFTIRYQQKGE